MLVSRSKDVYMHASSLSLYYVICLQDNPDVFMPERMLTPEAQKSGDQMPFGYGPR